MDTEKISRIKAAVRSNFEDSPAIYQAFEEKHGFFRKLNEKLLTKMTVPPGALVLDVGCGTGVSSVQILEMIPGSTVWGLDTSSAMLETARSMAPESNRLHFVEGDAASLLSCFDFKFHAIIYSASIFLIPDYEESLRQAAALVQKGGSVGLTFMDGLYDTDGKNVLALADQRAGEGVNLRKPVELAKLHASFRKTFPRERSWKEDMRLPIELLRDFFSVPAMSAGLFPKLAYSERVRKVSCLFDQMPDTQSFFRWILMVGEVD